VTDPNPAGDIELPPSLRFLQRLVTVLMLTMIAGIVMVVWLLFTRLSDPTVIALPDHLTIPQGQTAISVTQGPGWIMVVTDAHQAVIFDAIGAPLGTVDLTDALPQ